jgi:CubicO group peptidase (beta-lactamase class C family)
LGLVVQKVSGQPFGDFLRERIFKPLHMDRTVAYRRGRNEVPERAFGHTLDNGAWRETDQSSTSATLGDGGVYSSLEDLARWDAGLRAHALLSEAEMLPAMTPAKLPEPAALSPEGKPVQYGFGWFLEPYRGNARMWHYGETMGFRSAIERFPAAGLTVIVLLNRADTPAPDVALKIADLYLQ